LFRQGAGSRKRLDAWRAIVFSYDCGHMFCALDDVFAKFVTAITGSGLNKLLCMQSDLEA